MALFDTFKKKPSAKVGKKEEKNVPVKKEKEVNKVIAKGSEVSKGLGETKVFSKTGGIDLSLVIREPRITEKATMLADRGVYVFDVHQSATKPMIAQAIMTKFGVTPRKVSVLRIEAKRRKDRRTGKISHTSSGRKAIVYLKKGDKIEFV